MGEAPGMTLRMLVNMFNFPLYLLSGGVPGAWDLFAPAMLEENAAPVLYFPHHVNARRTGGSGQ